MLFARSSRRVVLIDEIRGLCILLMVVYHAAYDIVYLFGINIPAFHWPVLYAAQQFVAGIFICISGISCRFSRNNLKRGVIVLLLGLCVTGFTYFFFPGEVIYFGILHFLGVAMILFALLEKALDFFPPFFGMLFGVLLFIFTYNVPNGYLHLPLVYSVSLPAPWYSIKWLLPLGFGGMGSDYFPIIPWIFLFFAGSQLGLSFTEGQAPLPFYETHNRFLAKCGRHTLIIYILHQPVVYGVLWGVFWLLSKLNIV